MSRGPPPRPELRACGDGRYTWLRRPATDADEAEWLTLTRGQYESFCSFAGQQSRSFIGYLHPSRRVDAYPKTQNPRAAHVCFSFGFGAKLSLKGIVPRLAGTWIDLSLQPLRLLSLKRHRCCPAFCT